ncbi:hypothetical protein ABW21_db0209565 [Orbilia brochopaga]|nr:hypothetical protein ABW21_db0209565 [Drechslerella brochopaga]
MLQIKSAFAVMAFTSLLTAAMPTFNEHLGEASVITGKHGNTVHKRDHAKSLDIMQSRPNLTEAYSLETDNKWIKIDTEFPVRMFSISSTSIYISMNGLISLEPPVEGCLSTSNKALPIEPSSDTSQDPSCIPQNSVAAFWRDLWFPPNTTDLNVRWTWHDAIGHHIGHHYHIEWRACDKASSLSDIPSSPTKGGAAVRAIQLNFYQSMPGFFYISYSDGTPKHLREATIGAQSYPHFVQADVPESVTAAVDVCITLDTNNGTVEFVEHACRPPGL